MLKNPLKDTFVITQKFGKNPHIYKQFGLKGHNGIDLRTALPDTPKGRRYCYAAKDGRVIEITNQGRRGYGLFIRLGHTGTEQTVYGHLARSYVRKGQIVKAGQRIGLTDNTGFSTGAHLHFGWRPCGFNYDNGYKGYEDPLPEIGKTDKIKKLLEYFNELIEKLQKAKILVKQLNWAV